MRKRASAVIFEDNKVLLVRDRGHHKYSLPGGGIKKGETVVSAVAREIYEELGLHTVGIRRLRDCEFRGSLSKHKVCLLKTRGTPRLRGRELDKWIWWDMKTKIPTCAHVRHILSKILGKLN